MDRIERFVISVLVANHSGVLSRVSGMFTRRGFNIDTLTVGETESPEFSRITISTHCDRSICNQIVKQLEKMYDGGYCRIRSDHREIRLPLSGRETIPSCFC